VQLPVRDDTAIVDEAAAYLDVGATDVIFVLRGGSPPTQAEKLATLLPRLRDRRQPR